ncbi:N-6 DNA methylase [Mucilaginibacter sp. OK098]|uniref:N-6 DNA methylase n=1 Tax=Mucilaginibacter sp. OK098 TaxID=1855297 RepID=UPI00091663DE|nr:N-6 DNA methylase [Mucilaginibacter sp. OK098]SHN26127.1 N-6 DNA Methylase [Mucilaginibacter sp. OK098]
MKDNNKLFSLFDQFAYTQNHASAFSNMLDFFLMAFKRHDAQQDRLKALELLTTHPKREQLVALYAEIGELSEGFHDPLGQLFEQRISNGRKGQFFTPEPLTEFMARSMGIDSLLPKQTVCDPACGSGRMLLAVAKINRHLHFYGADIDVVCCKMAVINMVLNSLTGEIAHMDTLANEFFKGYKTGTVLKDGYHYPCFAEFSDPNESYIWLRPIDSKESTAFDAPFIPTKSPLMSSGVQGSLFDLS